MRPLVLLSIMLAPAACFAHQVKLAADVATPLVQAGHRQSVFLKVALTGPDVKREARTPVNVTLVIDRSGSMAGEKIERAREAAITALQSLDKNDIVAVVAFDTTVSVVVPATKVTDREAIAAAIRNIEPAESTALFAGVAKGAEELRKFIDKNHVNRVILLSDGMANVGPSSPGELAELGTSLGKERIAVTTLGLGLGYNEDLMTRLAQASDGNHAFVEGAADLARIFKAELGDVLSVVAQDVDVTIRCAEGVKPLRVLGRDAVIDGATVTTALSQLYASQEKYLMLEVEAPALASGEKHALATVEVRYEDMISHAKFTQAAAVAIEGSGDTAMIDKRTNGPVMVSVIEMVANDRNKLALTMRDNGEIEKARSLLRDNAAYIGGENKRYQSPKLMKLQKQNDESSDNLDETNWNKTRKKMKGSEHALDYQQAYE